MRRSVVWLALPVMIAAAAVAVCLPRFGGSERPKARDAPVGGAAGHAAADPEPLAPIDPEAPPAGTDAAPTGPQVAPPVPRGTEATPSPTTEAQLREALDRDGVEGLLRARPRMPPIPLLFRMRPLEA